MAGISSGLLHKESDQELLIKANVLGMLNAQEKMTGHVNMANYQALYDQLIVKRYKMALTEQKRARLENFQMKMALSQLLPLTNVVL